MNIIQLDIVNQKTIKCFEKTLNGGNLEVAGDTGTGKTTAVSALWEVLKKGSDTLTHGELKGHIRVTIGDGSDTTYVAERVNTPKTSSINITKFVGKIPRAVSTKDFEQMLSGLSVNPHKIADMKPKERTQALLSAAELEIDLDALDEEIKAAEGERLYAKRAADDAKPGRDMPEKVEAVSVLELTMQRDEILSSNMKVENQCDLLDRLVGERNELSDEIEALQVRLKLKQDSFTELTERISKGTKWCEENQLQPTTDLDEQIASAEETNKQAALYQQAVEQHEKHNKLVDARQEADQKVKSLAAKRKAALDSAAWPLGGLCVNDGDVYYNDMLFDNLGESEQMLVTAAIALGDIEKHDIKIVRMDGIESMSQKDYETLRDLFNGRGVQVLSTRVSRNGAEDNEIEIVEGTYTEEN